MTEERGHDLVPPYHLVVGEVSHHTIELSWGKVEAGGRTGPPELWTRFCVEEMYPKPNAYRTIYIGYSTHHIAQGLEPSTSYRFRLRVSKPTGESCYSPVVSVSTSREPPSGRNLHQAVIRNDEEGLRKVLLSGTVNVNVVDRLGFSPLMMAAQRGFGRLVHILLEHDADVHMRNGSGMDSLMLACFSGHLDVVRYLRRCGAAWGGQAGGGWTALHWAVDGGHLPVITYMIQDGCELDARDSVSHWTPLMRVSAVSGNVGVASLLIGAGADVNARDKDGKTPLMVAVLNNHEELVGLLLDSGADHDVRNEFGSGAAEMAKAFGRHNIIGIFERRKIT